MQDAPPGICLCVSCARGRRGTFVINSTPDIVAVLFIDHPHGDDRDDDDNEDKDDDDDENNVYWGSELLPEQIEYFKSEKFHNFF